MSENKSREVARENISELRQITKNISKLNSEIHSKNGSAAKAKKAARR